MDANLQFEDCEVSGFQRIILSADKKEVNIRCCLAVARGWLGWMWIADYDREGDSWRSYGSQ